MPLRYTVSYNSSSACIIKQAFYGNYNARCAPKIIIVDNTQTTIQRISQQLQLTSQRGRTMFVPVVVNYLGRSEGQSGGSGTPPRN
jgi:hypothetical protein